MAKRTHVWAEGTSARVACGEKDWTPHVIAGAKTERFQNASSVCSVLDCVSSKTKSILYASELFCSFMSEGFRGVAFNTFSRKDIAISVVVLVLLGSAALALGN